MSQQPGRATRSVRPDRSGSYERAPRPTRQGPPRGIGGGNVNSTLSIIIAVLAVLLGFFILRDIRSDQGAPVAGGGETASGEVTTETTVEQAPATTTTLLLTAFKVQIANASGVAGSAGQLTTELQGRGYIVQPAMNKSEITPKQTVTVVYYLLGSETAAAAIATEPSNAATVSRKPSTSVDPAARRRDTRAGITLASVVMGWAKRSSWRARKSAWLSTSPLSAATRYAWLPAASSSSLFTGCALGSEMMPTLAHRVWPSTATRASGWLTARRSRSSATIAARIARVLSPSSPISAAAL